MNNIVIGILAHVDAGKTTLSEAMLYESGSIREMGRVDKGDAFLDHHALERERGITIFSKQAVFPYGDKKVILLDTPGHVDFSAETERTLQVLDYAILVINGADGVQGHTITLWKLLKKYRIPVFLFINKMDQEGTDRDSLLAELNSRLNSNCVDFGNKETEVFYENIAMCDENAMDAFLRNGKISEQEIIALIKSRKLFPCFFGAALKLEGVGELMRGLSQYAQVPYYPAEFGAKVYKIARDEQGNRLTFLKITGGGLKVKTPVTKLQEKVNQIRIYSGIKYETVSEVQAGDICAVTGLSDTYAGEGIGREAASPFPVLTPVFTYRIKLSKDCDSGVMLSKLKQLEEEEPELSIVWHEALKEIQMKLMGDIQIEVVKRLIQERFEVVIELDEGSIVYKETIEDTVEGVGHFEPLRHYAEVHLLLEAGERGSGLAYFTDLSEDELDRNWQRLIMTHLKEKEHKGVLTGAAITDMRITLIAGRAHKKHTEGGDFRQATYRAVRQGLKQAKSVLLEPYYEFVMELPKESIGRAMADVERMGGTFEVTPQTAGAMAVIIGNAPVVSLRGYQRELTSYTKGMGRLSCTFKGYEPCHNAEEVIKQEGYDSERDLESPTGSVFCAHGAGYFVDWVHVKDCMHIEGRLYTKEQEGREEEKNPASNSTSGEWLGTEEVDRILARTLYTNKREGNKPRKLTAPRQITAADTAICKKPPRKLEKYLLVDGYNIIYAWEDLKEIASVNVDGARGKLLDISCNYQAIAGCHLIAVFDAYRVQGHATEILNYHNIHVVYTKEAETADQYIEKFAYINGKKYDVTVATSDGLEQIITRGQGCRLLSASELKEEIERAGRLLKEEYENKQPKSKNYMFDSIPESKIKLVNEMTTDKDEKQQ